MNELDLRALVREAVARHMGGGHAAPARESLPVRTAAPREPHPSHGLYVTLINSSDACVIEPSVRCDHCGYCKSHGH